jgi:hypothetical protein
MGVAFAHLPGGIRLVHWTGSDAFVRYRWSIDCLCRNIINERITRGCGRPAEGLSVFIPNDLVRCCWRRWLSARDRLPAAGAMSISGTTGRCFPSAAERSSRDVSAETDQCMASWWIERQAADMTEEITPSICNHYKRQIHETRRLSFSGAVCNKFVPLHTQDSLLYVMWEACSPVPSPSLWPHTGTERISML